jgi:hypothetical protein
MNDFVQIDAEGTTEHIGVVDTEDRFAVQQSIDFQPVKSGPLCEFGAGDTLFGDHSPQDVTHRHRKGPHVRRRYPERNRSSIVADFAIKVSKNEHMVYVQAP